MFYVRNTSLTDILTIYVGEGCGDISIAPNATKDLS